MNLIIRRGRKNGILYCRFYDSTEDELDLGGMSKMLTGTDGCDPYNGIFVGGQRGALKQVVRCNFKYGHVEKALEFPIIDFEHDDVLLIQDLLKDRIRHVKKWIESVDYEEELEFSV